MDSNQQVLIEPTNLPHPGEIVTEYLEFHGWSQRDLARRSGLTPKTISKICNGKAAISLDSALRLERVFQRPARLWLNLQRQFDETVARQKMLAQSVAWNDWAESFPISEMRSLKYSLQPSHSDVDSLLGYLGVSSPECWESVWSAYGIAYRQTRRLETNPVAVSTWVRETELMANQLETALFDAEKCNALTESLRPLTRVKVKQSWEEIQDIFAKAGVAVVCVPELTATGISGCARWLRPQKALIGLTHRYKSDDQMWFSLLHELGHLLLHQNKRPFVVDNVVHDFFDRIVDPKMQRYEDEANRFAADALIPPDVLDSFVKQVTITNVSIQTFASEIGIAPGILVSRLQDDEYIAADQHNALKNPFGWTDSLEE